MKNTVSIFNQAELLEWSGTSAFESMRNYMSVITLAAGDTLCQQGENDKKFYVLLSGELEAQTDRDGKVNTTVIEPGRAVGETTLLTGRPYSATVKATQTCKLIAISQKTFEQLIRTHPEIKNFFNNIITPRIHENYLFASLRNLFGHLDDEVLEFIQSHVTWQHLNMGEVLFQQGELGTDLAIVVTGRLQVIVNETLVVADIHHGEMVGEMALLTDEPRSATVKAIRQTTIVRLSRQDFEKLMHLHPSLLINITRTIIHRQQITQKGRKHENLRSLNFAIVFLDGMKFDFIIALAQKLNLLGKTAIYDAERFNVHYGQSGAAQMDLDSYVSMLLNRWLAELEIQNNYVLYVADSDWSNWTVRCLQNSDRILLVADSTESPNLREIEHQLTAHFPQLRQDLILMHPPETESPTGTRAWLEPRHVTKYYHVRRGDDAHIARLSRSLTGNAYGLALSGGGATGIAHIGVIKAIEELGIPIDMVGGTSIGALIGAGLAVGQSVDTMLTIAENMSHRRRIIDLTLPFVSLLKSQKIINFLNQLTAGIQIEDMWLPFYAVTTNLTQAVTVPLIAGSLNEALRTSMSLPGVLPPIHVNDELFVDGAIMNNFPVDVMHDMIEGGYVLGVMVSPVTKQKEQVADLTPNISGWRILLNRLNPFSKKLEVPALMDTLTRSLQVNSQFHFQTVEHLADLAIVLDENYYRFYEVDKYKEIIELGYTIGRAQLETWWEAHQAED